MRAELLVYGGSTLLALWGLAHIAALSIIAH